LIKIKIHKKLEKFSAEFQRKFTQQTRTLTIINKNTFLKISLPIYVKVVKNDKTLKVKETRKYMQEKKS